jgi:4-hydroxy-4-methyl-2-oxoglutarate aldolase
MFETMDEKLGFLSTCETGYVNDALNLLGIKNCIIENALPLKRGETVVGQAFTAQLSRIRKDEKRYTLYEVANECPIGRVLVYSGAEGYTLLGENISTLMCNKGIKAVVLDGKCRDVDGISALPMQVFCEGASPRLTPPDLVITDIDATIYINGVKVNPGDVIIGDSDGVVVIPLERLDDVIKQVEWVAEVEHEAAEAIKDNIDIIDFQAIIYKKKNPRV